MRPDGCLLHMGRKDFLVKIRGYSVQPAEVEAALLSNSSIQEAVVVAREKRNGEQSLVAYLVPTENTVPDLVNFRILLSQRLPDYMVPSRFVILDAMPRDLLLDHLPALQFGVGFGHLHQHNPSRRSDRLIRWADRYARKRTARSAG